MIPETEATVKILICLQITVITDNPALMGKKERCGFTEHVHTWMCKQRRRRSSSSWWWQEDSRCKHHCANLQDNTSTCSPRASSWLAWRCSPAIWPWLTTKQREGRCHFKPNKLILVIRNNSDTVYKTLWQGCTGYQPSLLLEALSVREIWGCREEKPIESPLQLSRSLKGKKYSFLLLIILMLTLNWSVFYFFSGSDLKYASEK